MREIDEKLDEVLEKLTVSKLDNSFVIALSFLSILFGLSNLLLTDLSHRRTLMIGAVAYFLVPFYIGYLRGAIRDNWGFRVLGWISQSLSTAIILVALLMLLMIETRLEISPLLPTGLVLLFGSIAIYLSIRFMKDVGRVIPNFKDHLLSMSPILMRYVAPFVGPLIDPYSSKLLYASILTFFVTGIVLSILGILLI